MHRKDSPGAPCPSAPASPPKPCSFTPPDTLRFPLHDHFRAPSLRLLSVARVGDEHSTSFDARATELYRLRKNSSEGGCVTGHDFTGCGRTLDLKGTGFSP